MKNNSDYLWYVKAIGLVAVVVIMGAGLAMMCGLATITPADAYDPCDPFDRWTDADICIIVDPPPWPWRMR